MEKITDVAKYFLSKEKMTHKKLQKLCYYAQAWHLANYNTPLVSNDFEAWVHGPVCPDLYVEYKDWGWLPISLNNSEKTCDLKPETKRFLNYVYDVYGQYSGDELENISHQEKPWNEARVGYSKTDYCRNMISSETMKNYYKVRIDKTNGK